MRSLPVCLVLVWGTFAAGALGAGEPPRITHGVAVGDVTASSAVVWSRASAAFFAWNPIVRHAEEPERIYRSFRWGRDVEFFLLDARGKN